MMYLARGSGDSAIQAAQIAAVASVFGAIVSIIIAVYNNRMRLKAEEKMYVAKMYIDNSAQLQKALDRLWREVNEIGKVISKAYHYPQTVIPRDMLNNKAYNSLKDGTISPDWLEIERIVSYYPELIDSVNDLKDSFISYHSKLKDSIHKPARDKLANLIHHEKPCVERNLVKVKIGLQSLVTAKIKMMNDDNKSMNDRIGEKIKKRF